MSLWRAKDRLILASKSSPRQALLKAAGIPVDVVPASLDERAVEGRSGLTDPARVAEALAVAKAEAVAVAHPGRLVLGADQTLALGARRFSKPRNAEDATEQLLALSGKTHALHSAIALVRDGRTLFSHVASAHMTMRQFDRTFVAAYLREAGDAVLSSVGAYQLESLGAHLFSAIEGDYFTILGLPLLPLLDYLRREGMLA